MAREDAEQNFRDTMNMFEKTLQAIAAALEAIAAKLKNTAEYQPYKEIAEWLKSENSLKMYQYRGDDPETFKALCAAEKIPIIPLVGKENMYLIRDVDADLVQGQNRRELITEMNYYQEIPASEFENAVATATTIKNKDMLMLHNLSDEEAEVLKNKCSSIAKGFMVGTGPDESGNGKTVLVTSDKIWSQKTDADTVDFSKAWLQTCLSYYGPNKEIKQQELMWDAMTDKSIYGFDPLSDDEASKNQIGYVYSETPRNTDSGILNYRGPVVMIDKDGFKAYEYTSDANGKQDRHEIGSCGRDDVNYLSELQRYVSKIHDRNFTTDEEEYHGIMSGEITPGAGRPQRNEQQKAYAIVSDQIDENIDSMIKKKFAGHEFSSAEEAFNTYQSEAMKIMDAVINGEEKGVEWQFGYSTDDIFKIQDMIEKAGLKPEDFREASEHLEKSGAEMHEARAFENEKEEAKSARTTFRKDKTERNVEELE